MVAGTGRPGEYWVAAVGGLSGVAHERVVTAHRHSSIGRISRLILTS
jgi:hypothetical protein